MELHGFFLLVCFVDLFCRLHNNTKRFISKAFCPFSFWKLSIWTFYYCCAVYNMSSPLQFRWSLLHACMQLGATITVLSRVMWHVWLNLHVACVGSCCLYSCVWTRWKQTCVVVLLSQRASSLRLSPSFLVSATTKGWWLVSGLGWRNFLCVAWILLPLMVSSQ